jgi:hypothetical protein
MFHTSYYQKDLLFAHTFGFQDVRLSVTFGDVDLRQLSTYEMMNGSVGQEVFVASE